jgi:hypothetical protein
MIPAPTFHREGEEKEKEEEGPRKTGQKRDIQKKPTPNLRPLAEPAG